jgi:NADH-quinone oxidoreductase subunit L
MNANQIHFLLFFVPLVTAGLTAFYMFRLWFYTFAGTPRDQELHDHARESPMVMTIPLLVLSFFAIFVAYNGENGPLFGLLLGSEPAHVGGGAVSVATAGTTAITMPSHTDVLGVHSQAGWYALIAAVSGAIVAYLLYGARVVDPADIKHKFSGVHTFLVEKWRFDELYDVMFVRPVHVVARWCSGFDRGYIDGLLHWFSRKTVDVAHWDRKFDENVIDGLVNWTATVVFKFGRSLRHVQTGLLRQYVMFIALGVLTLFLLLFVMFPA